jgi:AcrR family transcriptional regulator
VRDGHSSRAAEAGQRVPLRVLPRLKLGRGLWALVADRASRSTAPTGPSQSSCGGPARAAACQVEHHWQTATTAGVTRQTVYAHFPSRDALIAALLHAVGVETVAAMEAAHLDTVPPADALRRYLDIGWQLIRGYPFLLGPALAQNPEPGDSAAHQAGTALLEQVIQRGQRDGDFDRAFPADWLAVAIVGLVRTGAEQFIAGRLTTSQAAALALDSALRLCGAASARVTRGQAPE